MISEFFESAPAHFHFAGFRHWTASLLPALIGTTLPFWLRPPAFSFRWFAAIEFLFATVLFHTGFSFLQASFEGKFPTTWTKSRLQINAGMCIVLACLLGLHINTGLTLYHGVPRSIFLIYGLSAVFAGVLYVVPPLNFYRRVGGEIVVAEGLGMIPVLGAYLVQVGDITRTVYLASLPLVVTTGLWVWIEELASKSDDEKTGRRTLVIDFGLKFSARFGILALAMLFFATIIIAVISGSTSPLTLIAFFLAGLVWKIVIVSWNEYLYPERIVALAKSAFMLHFATGLIFSASSLAAYLGKAG